LRASSRLATLLPPRFLALPLDDQAAARTLSVGRSAIAGHSAHPDDDGPCEDDEEASGDEDGGDGDTDG